jgi:hypothetical protein
MEMPALLSYGADWRTVTDADRLAPNICISVQIEAEIRRVLYALVTPEYMEAWIRLPEADRVECQAEHRSFDEFRIDLFSNERKQESLYGRCQLAKPDRVTYLWERGRIGGSGGSIAEIRLRGSDPRKCTLTLRHSGLWGREELDWYANMWNHSLPKLRTLVEGI